MITTEAIEAASKALYALENAGRSACPFDELPQVELDVRFEMVKVALEAAAPHIEKADYERGWGAGFRHHKEVSQ